jgi:hypothetical protein
MYLEEQMKEEDLSPMPTEYLKSAFSATSHELLQNILSTTLHM